VTQESLNIIVPLSGGKDSTACLVMALEHSDNVQAIFNDTGWEHPITYNYLEYLEQKLGIKIDRTIGGKRKNGDDGDTLPNLIRAQGRFPFGLGRFCTTHLKQYALRDAYKNHYYDGETKYQFWFGMRQDESVQRSKRYEGVQNDDLFDMNDVFPQRYNKKLRATIQVRMPIMTWTTPEVFEYLESKGIDKNPLYDEGTNDRVGCYPCMLAGKKVQKKMFATEFGQKRLETIRQLEKEIGQKYEMFDTDQGSCEVCKI
jgi:3'-phosphoadenosine 5'-phosphosulfate sulfotransferase (PAPS reductase)/FAD synthetase